MISTKSSSKIYPVRAQMEPSIAKMQLNNIPKLYKALGYSITIKTINVHGKVIHKIYVNKGEVANPLSSRLICIEELSL